MLQQLSYHKSSESREYSRSDNSLGTVAELLVNRTLERRIDSIKGLIIDDSFGGCGLIVVTQQPPSIGQKCYLNLADLESLEVEVRWLELVGENIYRIGLKYTEMSI